MSTSPSALDAQRFMVSVDLQAGGSRVVLERGDDLGVVAEQCFDIRGGLKLHWAAVTSRRSRSAA